MNSPYRTSEAKPQAPILCTTCSHEGCACKQRLNELRWACALGAAIGWLIVLLGVLVDSVI